MSPEIVSPEIAAIPKADMHVHLEATMTPAMARHLAARNGITLPPDLIVNDLFAWKDDGTAQGALFAFVHAYDAAAAVIRTPQDYTDITYDYLIRAAAEGCIYAEIGISADHGFSAGLTYPQMVDGIAAGVEKAKKETGIEARLISTFVRHYSVERAMEAAQATRDYPHPLVTGLGIAGDENAKSFKDFLPAYERAGLPCRTAHAGEAAGAESVRTAREELGVRRFGHMVRVVEDETLLRDLAKIKAVPEVCVSSNLCLKVYPSLKVHPLRRMFDAGLKVVLGSDDPSFFGTTIGREYALAHTDLGFSLADLRTLTRNAIEEAFVDEKTREMLMEKI
jgi:adenosine deaminase